MASYLGGSAGAEKQKAFEMESEGCYPIAGNTVAIV